MLSPFQNTIDVDTGEIRVSSKFVILQAVALGSCIAVVVYDRNKKIGGLAHVMLPGKSPTEEENTKYAENAIEALLSSTRKLGADIGDLEISLVGGANVLQEGDIPDKVIESVLGYLKEKQLQLKYMRVGGYDRRSAFLDTSSGEVYYTEGDNTTTIVLTKVEKF